ncbi:MAG: F0F1 ATP synthase subunit gamma, partial [Candidatus Eisenbacteria bacterium]
MAKMRQIKRRICSLQKTKQITKTMELVATARVKRTQQSALAAHPYADKLGEILSALDPAKHAPEVPLLRARDEVRRVGLLVVTSNRGLCGAFNTNVLRLARRAIQEIEEAKIEVQLHVVGRKGVNALRYRGYAIASSRTDVGDRPTMAQASEIARLFIDKFLIGEIDEFRILYASFRSLSSQPPEAETVLPLPFEGGGAEKRTEFLLEPSPR